MKKALLVIWLIVVFSGIAFLFWHNEWKYNLPTPVPLNYQAVNPGTIIHIKAVRPVKDNKLLFLHFFNPDCPCSRFNITHFKSLVKQYTGKISFAIVVLSQSKEYDATYIQHKYGLDMPVFLTALLLPNSACIPHHRL